LCNYFIPCFLLFIQFPPLLSLESKGVILWVFFLQLIPKSYIGTKCWLIPKDFDSNARVFTVELTLTPLAQDCVLWHTIYLNLLVQLVFRTEILILSLLLLLSLYILFVARFVLFCFILVVPSLLRC
jgi:hypothetical protein